MIRRFPSPLSFAAQMRGNSFPLRSKRGAVSCWTHKIHLIGAVMRMSSYIQAPTMVFRSFVSSSGNAVGNFVSRTECFLETIYFVSLYKNYSKWRGLSLTTVYMQTAHQLLPISTTPQSHARTLNLIIVKLNKNLLNLTNQLRYTPNGESRLSEVSLYFGANDP